MGFHELDVLVAIGEKCDRKNNDPTKARELNRGRERAGNEAYSRKNLAEF